MNQADLDKAVARATGETVTEIRKMGFSLLQPPGSGAPREGSGVPPSRPRRHTERRGNHTPKQAVYA
jgi:hypothetical protein